jgi:hypothetical protein
VKTGAALILAMLAVAGCGQQSADAGGKQAAPETVDVAPPLSVDTEGDVKAAPPKKGLVGVLPTDFPRDLPVYIPSSVIDFGKKDGRRFVVLQSQDGRGEVEAWLRRAAGPAGYKVEGSGGRMTLRKGERRVDLIVSGSGTSEFRYQY